MPTESPDRRSFDFDPEETAAAYRTILARLEADPENAGLLQIAVRLREKWRTWRNDESLDEIARGKTHNA
jgi:GTP cyclohydrolase I